MSLVTVCPTVSGCLARSQGFRRSAISRNTFVCCVLACTSPVAVQREAHETAEATIYGAMSRIMLPRLARAA
jgi:hypothetical protein